MVCMQDNGNGSMTRGTVNNVKLKSVRTIWLHTHGTNDTENGEPSNEPIESYLLIEDLETGDILMPLIYMKRVFAANYSRKLSSLKHRVVSLSKSVTGSFESDSIDTTNPSELLYWVWAFESPHEVKVLARQTLGEENAPQGHLRLVLIPIVYSAMAQKQELRETRFFQSLHFALKSSTYSIFFELLPPSLQVEIDEAEASASDAEFPAVFHGPFDLSKTLQKYTLKYSNEEEVENLERKRNRKLVTRNLSSRPGVLGSPTESENEGMRSSKGQKRTSGEQALELENSDFDPSKIAHILAQENFELRQEIDRICAEFGALLSLKNKEIDVLRSALAKTNPEFAEHYIEAKSRQGCSPQLPGGSMQKMHSAESSSLFFLDKIKQEKEPRGFHSSGNDTIVNGRVRLFPAGRFLEASGSQDGLRGRSLSISGSKNDLAALELCQLSENGHQGRAEPMIARQLSSGGKLCESLSDLQRLLFSEELNLQYAESEVGRTGGLGLPFRGDTK